MPERLVLPIHGGDHCPGGPDPIPCLEPGAIIAYAYINSALEQTDPFPDGEDNNPGLYSPFTQGFTSDENILFPDLTNECIWLAAEGDTGTTGGSSPGFYIASCTVAGWDNWSGGTTEVLDGVKGAGVYWDCATVDSRALVLPLDPPSMSQDIIDDESNCTDMNIVQAAPLNRIQPWIAQYSGVDAQFTQVSMFVVMVKPYLFIPSGTEETSTGIRTPDFGKWYEA